MPELPEVEVVKQSLEKYILNKNLLKIIVKNKNLRFPVPQDISRKLCNLKIILIRNLSYCKNEILLFLKNKIETCGNNYRFFLITDKITNINMKYKGLFHYINVCYEDKKIITNYFL